MSERAHPPSSGLPGRRSLSLSRSKIRLFIVFVSCVLVVNALAGERGLIETMRAKRRHQALATSIRTLHRENARLREQARRLREDPQTIEAIARQELGFIRPDELLFIIRDMPPADDPTEPAEAHPAR